MGSFGRLSSFWLKASDILKPEDDTVTNESQADARNMRPSTSGHRDHLEEYIDEGGDRRVHITETDSDDGKYELGLPPKWFSFRKLWMFMGPGFLMSIAYLVNLSTRAETLKMGFDKDSKFIFNAQELSGPFLIEISSLLLLPLFP